MCPSLTSTTPRSAPRAATRERWKFPQIGNFRYGNFQQAIFVRYETKSLSEKRASNARYRDRLKFTTPGTGLAISMGDDASRPPPPQGVCCGAAAPPGSSLGVAPAWRKMGAPTRGVSLYFSTHTLTREPATDILSRQRCPSGPKRALRRRPCCETRGRTLTSQVSPVGAISTS